jgi:hypothetical protein
MTKNPFPPGQKVLRDPEVVRFFVENVSNSMRTELHQTGIGVTHDDVRMRGNDELGTQADELV